MTRFWVGVASREHVRAAVDGGFCQLNHGKEAPVKRLHPGDRILYYSPREEMRAGETVQAFTAIGEVLEGEPWSVDLGRFRPFRRAVRFFDARDAPIRPLLAQLSFTGGSNAWGAAFRRGTFRIEADDYRIIADAMGADRAPSS